MVAAGVVHDQVDDDFDTSSMGFFNQALEIFFGAVFFVDLEVIDDVVAMIAGRLHDRHEPDAGHPQVVRRRGIAVVQIIQPLNEAVDVAHAVAVAVLKAAHEDLVEDGIVPPILGNNRRRRRWLLPPPAG